MQHIKEWPKFERPREKLLERGADYLSDAELLAIFVSSGTTGSSAVDVARNLLSYFGSLRGFLDAERAVVLSQLGIGPARYALLLAARELCRRYQEDGVQSCPTLTGPAATRRFLLSQLHDVPEALLACLYLDNRHRLLEYQILSPGDIALASVKPAQVVSDALAKKAVSVILVSHVPQGILESSPEDEQRIQELKEALSLVNVRVLDHVIVGGGRYVSLAELRQL